MAGKIKHPDLGAGAHTEAQFESASYHLVGGVADKELITTTDVELGADVTDAANVDAAGAVMETDYDANTILAANADNTPLPLTITAQSVVARAAGNIEPIAVAASQILGRTAASDLKGMTVAEVNTLLGTAAALTAHEITGTPHKRGVDDSALSLIGGSGTLAASGGVLVLHGPNYVGEEGHVKLYTVDAAHTAAVKALEVTHGDLVAGVTPVVNIPGSLTVNSVPIVSDAVYGAGWDGVTTIAPSKNALYDKIEAMSTGTGSRSATVVVAADNATASEKAMADYVCDGAADEVEINNAITFVTGYDGVVQLTSGTFVTAGSIIIKEGVWLRGMGTKMTLIQPSAIAADIVTGDGTDAATRWSVEVSHFRIDGSNQTAGSGLCIDRGWGTARIHDLQLDYCYDYGMYGDNEDDGYLHDPVIWNISCSHNGYDGIHFNQPYGVKFNTLYSHLNGASARLISTATGGVDDHVHIYVDPESIGFRAGHTVQLRNTGGAVIEMTLKPLAADAFIVNGANNYSLVFTAAISGIVAYTVASTAYVTQWGNGIYIEDGGESHFSGMCCDMNRGHGVHFKNTYKGIIWGGSGYIGENMGDGMKIEGGYLFQRMTIADCYIGENNNSNTRTNLTGGQTELSTELGSTYAYAGIEIDGDEAGIVIHGCQIGDSSSGGYTQGYGIKIVQTDTQGVEIFGNHFDGNMPVAILNNSLLNTVRIHDNIGSELHTAQGEAGSAGMALVAGISGTNPMPTCWENTSPTPLLITSAIVRRTTKSTGAATGDLGIVASSVVEDCEDAWNELVDGDATSVLDTQAYKMGSGSVKLTCTADIDAGDRIATEAVAAKDLSTHVAIALWIKVSAVVAAGDLSFIIDEEPLCVSIDERIPIPALAKDIWTRVILPYVKVPTEATRNAVVSIGLEYTANPKANTINIDDIRSIPTAANLFDDQDLNAAEATLYSATGTPIVCNGQGASTGFVVLYPSATTAGMVGSLGLTFMGT